MRQVGYLQNLYRDARSTEHKIYTEMHGQQKIKYLSYIFLTEFLYIKFCSSKDIGSITGIMS